MVWHLLRRKLPPFDLAVLEKMPQTVGGVTNPLYTLATAAHPESGHAVKLDPPWATFERAHVQNPANSRRRRRKLDELGSVRFVIAKDADQRSAFFEAMMSMKREKFLDTKGYDVFTNPGFGKFYREITRRLGEGGPVQLSALMLDDKILAAHWGYVANGRFYHLMPAHASGDWRHYAPGRLLNEWLLQWALENGLEFFDLGIGDEPYKLNFCDLVIPLRDALLPVSARGHLFAAMLRAKRGLKLSLRATALAPSLIAVRNFWRRRGRPQAAATAARR